MLEKELEAERQKSDNARRLLKLLYSEIKSKNITVSPTEMAFEVYKRTVLGSLSPAIVIWATDTSKEILRKIVEVKNATNRDYGDNVEEGIENILKTLKEISPSYNQSLQTTNELFLTVRTYENPTRTRRGFVIFKNSDMKRIDFLLKKWFDKGYEEIETEAMKE